MDERARLQRDGYILLRQAIAPDLLDGLRSAFDAGVKPADQWPVPRGTDYRHSLLDDNRHVQAVCRLPQVLAAVGTLIGEGFFLAQVEGREPLPGRGHQRLHRDLSMQRPGDIANAIAYFDDYGPDNGATRLVPGSHRPQAVASAFDFDDESAVIQLSGRAGDILVFDVDLVHAGSLNPSGARRRSILIGYFAVSLHEAHLQSMALRGVRMDTRERFAPDSIIWP